MSSNIFIKVKYGQGASVVLRFFLTSAGFAGLLALAGCDNNPGSSAPFEHDSADVVYRFAATNLDTFFIYRDRMPRSLYSFETPEALYRSVNDRYTEFYNKEKAKCVLAQQDTVRRGVGIVVDSVANGYLIIEVLAGSPAERDGLHVSDTIVQIEGIPVAGMEFDEFFRLLQGKDRTDEVIRVKRGIDFIEIVVVPSEFRPPSIWVDSVGRSTAMITIRGFHPQTCLPGGTAEEFSEAIEKTSWASNLVLDLRSNTGGYVNQCLFVVSELVPTGTPIISVRYREVEQHTGVPREFENTFKAFGPGRAVDRKLYVLVDSLTASASEIIVSCLMRRDRVTVIGDTTFGKGSGQILLDNGPDSVMARITFMTIHPVGDNGESYDGKGIVPDLLCTPSDALDIAMQMIGETLPAKRRIGGAAGKYHPERCDLPLRFENTCALFSRQDILLLKGK